MLRVSCPSCNARLNAKEELAGQVRKCPKCRTPIQIPWPESTGRPEDDESITLDEPDPDQKLHGASDIQFKKVEVPERLNRDNRYLICDKWKLVASWKADGKGWVLHTSAGPLPAARSQEALPAQGDFQLVELRLGMTDAGHQLSGITVFKLAERYALTKLERGDHQILTAVKNPGCLTRTQKDVVRQTIKDQLMYDVWKGADKVLEFLSNTDYHSPGAR